MFTITWSATVPPSRRWVAAQRWSIVVGVAAVLAGVTGRVQWLVWVGGVAVVAGLVLLGVAIYRAVRRSLLRRFDLSARFYLLAFAAGSLGVSLGMVMGAGAAGTAFPTIRLVHAHLNLVGLVGLTILGTLPTLLPTTAYHAAVSGREAIAGWWLAVGGVTMITLGLADRRLVGLGALFVAGAGLLIVGGILFRLRGAGRRTVMFTQIALGSLWLIGWALADGIRLLAGSTMTPFSGWTGAVVVAGVGQVLAGSLTYLIPVLKRSPFVPNRRVMEARPWLPLLTLNGAGIALGLGAVEGAVLLLGLWLADFALRVFRVVSGRAVDMAGVET